VTITDDADNKLNEIINLKFFKNRATAVEWIIEEACKSIKER